MEYWNLLKFAACYGFVFRSLFWLIGSSRQHPLHAVKVCRMLYRLVFLMDERIITVNVRVPVVYMARDVMILMRATSITRAIGRGRGGGAESQDFFGP
jgi:hypothetical protein